MPDAREPRGEGARCGACGHDAHNPGKCAGACDCQWWPPRAAGDSVAPPPSGPSPRVTPEDFAKLRELQRMAAQLEAQDAALRAELGLDDAPSGPPAGEARDDIAVATALARCAMHHPTPAVRRQIARLADAWEVEGYGSAAGRLRRLLEPPAADDGVRVVQSREAPDPQPPAPDAPAALTEKERKRLAVALDAADKTASGHTQQDSSVRSWASVYAEDVRALLAAVERVTRERNEARERAAQMLDEWRAEANGLEDKLRAAEAERDALRADAERLDWLNASRLVRERHVPGRGDPEPCGYSWVLFSGLRHADIRSAIDAARAGGAAP